MSHHTTQQPHPPKLDKSLHTILTHHPIYTHHTTTFIPSTHILHYHTTIQFSLLILILYIRAIEPAYHEVNLTWHNADDSVIISSDIIQAPGKLPPIFNQQIYTIYVLLDDPFFKFEYAKLKVYNYHTTCTPIIMLVHPIYLLMFILFLLIYLSIYLLINLFIYLFIYLLVYLSIYLYIYLFIYLFIY
jgi:hypothetical protein